MITKNKLKKVLVVYSISMLAMIIISSCDITENYKLDSISATAFKITGIDEDLHSTFDYYLVEEITNTESPVKIRFDSLAVEVSTSIFVSEGVGLNSNIGVKSAHANDPVYEEIVDIVITSDQDYNDDFPKGTNLADLLSIRHGRITQGMNITDFLNTYNFGSFIAVGKKLLRKLSRNQRLLFKLSF